MKKQSDRNMAGHSPGRPVNQWFLQHLRAFFLSLGQLYKYPGSSLFSIAVIGISLALPAGFYSLLENAQRITSHLDAASHISLFLAPDVDEQRTLELSAALQERADIDEVEVIDPGRALAEYKENSGFAAALDTLGQNPLPYVLVVRPRVKTLVAPGNAALLETLRSLPEVDAAQFDWQWAQRLHQIIEVFQRAVLIVAGLFAGAVVLVVGNTIRMAVYSRRPEIEIHKLFGATDAFITRPFLYSGMLHGTAGSLLAWLMLEVSMMMLQGPVTRLSDLYGSPFTPVSLSATEGFGLILIGAGLGLAGSWLSVKRHLRAIDPL